MIIAYLAVSADGYIARPDGDVEWLNERPRNKRADAELRKFGNSVDTILIGRGTYDWAAAYFRKTGHKDGFVQTGVKHYAFSRRPPRHPLPGVEFVKTPLKKFVKRLRETPGKNIWLMGGGKLIASFLDAGELDEFDLHVVPVLIGKGIPLLAPGNRYVPLQLIASNKYSDGSVRLRYQVRRR